MKKETHQKNPQKSIKTVLAEIDRKHRIAEQALVKAPALGFVQGAKYKWEDLKSPRRVNLPLYVTSSGEVACKNGEIIFMDGQWPKILKEDE